MPTARLYCARYLLPIAAPAIEDGALLVDKGRILAVGRRREIQAAAPSGTAAVDFGEAVLLPPLANAHTHLELTDYPCWAAEAGRSEAASSFVGWIRQVIDVKRRIAPERFVPSVERGIAESLAAGTGAVGDILSWLPARAAHADSPLRGRLFLEILGRDPMLFRRMLDALGKIWADRRAGLLDLGLSPHSPFTLSAEHLQAALDLARRRRLPITMHLGESPAELRFLADSAGEIADDLYPCVGWQDLLPPPARRSPVAYLEEQGGLQSAILLAHGVQVNETDIRRLASTGAAVVLCSRSNARLDVGKAPVRLYRQAGVPLALGTDSRASCPSLSIWDELAFAHSWFAGELTPAAWLAIATASGAAVLGLEGEMGLLAPGSGSHFQVLAPADLPPFHELEEFLCAPGRTAEVRHLYLGGRDVLA